MSAQERLEQLKSFHAKLCAFWRHHGESFRAHWTAQSPDARRQLLLSNCPYMPRSANDPRSVDGSDVRGALVLHPEMNLEALVASEELPNRIDRLAAMPFEDVFAECQAHIDALERSKAVKTRRCDVIVNVFNGETYQVKDRNGVKEIIQTGGMVWLSTFENYLSYLTNTLGLYTGYCDDYKTDILQRSGQLIRAAIVQTCANCAVGLTALTAKRCSRCNSVFYCSKECQLVHWKTHKPLCRPGQAAATKSLESDFSNLKLD